MVILEMAREDFLAKEKDKKAKGKRINNPRPTRALP
jgi:hypothetical protein